MSCDSSACEACLQSMTAVENTVCSTGSDVLGSMCTALSEAGSDDPFTAFFAGVVCGTAVGVGCQAIMEYNFDSSICQAMFSNGCCGDSSPTTPCTTCPQDCAKIGSIVQTIYQQSVDDASKLCNESYDGSFCNALLSRAQVTTDNSFKVLSEMTDYGYSLLNPQVPNGCSTCYPGCLSVLSMSLQPPVSSPVYAADVGAMYAAVQLVAQTVASHLVNRSQPLWPMQTNTYVGVQPDGSEANLSAVLSITSIAMGTTVIQGPSQTTGALETNAGATVSFSVTQTYTVAGSYSIDQVVILFQTSSSVTTTPIATNTVFSGATLTLTFPVSFVMDPTGSFFTAVPFIIEANSLNQSQFQASLSSIAGPSYDHLLNSCLATQQPLLVQNPPVQFDNIPWTVGETPSAQQIIQWMSPMCVSPQGTVSRPQAVLSQTVNGPFVWTNQYSPPCGQPINSVFQWTAMTDPQTSFAQIANYQPLSQLYGIMNFVSTGLAFSLNLTRGQPGTMGQASNATYVLMQGYAWAMPQSWAGLYANPSVLTVNPKRPTQPASGLGVYVAQVNGTTYNCQVDQQGNMSAVPALGQLWDQIWNVQVAPFLQSIGCAGYLAKWTTDASNLTSAQASISLTLTSSQYPTLSFDISLMWSILSASVTQVGVTVTGSQDQPLNWNYVWNNQIVVANQQTVAQLMQTLLSLNLLVYTAPLQLTWG